MLKYERYYYENGKEIKVLYVVEIIKGDMDQEFTALEMVAGDLGNYDAVYFKYTDGSSQRVDNKK